jgi:hypothetical protein
MKTTYILIIYILTSSCIIADKKVDSNNTVIATLPQKAISDSLFYWETLSEDQKKEFLNLKGISIIALDFYYGKTKTSDNDLTSYLLDTLTSINNSNGISSFYFFLFNKICENADGSLAEILGTYCQKMILKSPSYVLNYFSKNKNILNKYASLLGYELYFKEDGSSEIEYNFHDFKKILSDKLDDKKKYNNILNHFFNEIENNIKKMN